MSIPVDELSSLGLLGFDAVLGEPGKRVVAVSPDEAAPGEPGVVGDLGNGCRGQVGVGDPSPDQAGPAGGTFWVNLNSQAPLSH